LAQSDDVDRSLSAVDRSSLRHPPIVFVDQLSILEKFDQGCRKDHRIPEFSGVVSSTLPSPTPAEVVGAGSPPLTDRSYGHHNPYLSAATITASSRA
jgi:hypothetical protein